MDCMTARATGIAGGLEPELAAAIDGFFPLWAVADGSHDFIEEFPATPLPFSPD
ncbi:hypothetical protein EV128_12026 [Rhizobium azibense]|nr:hypothetical protein EV128_12026 [Rhizobium azibense]